MREMIFIFDWPTFVWYTLLHSPHECWRSFNGLVDTRMSTKVDFDVTKDVPVCIAILLEFNSFESCPDRGLLVCSSPLTHDAGRPAR